ncbi:hypothetical protein [Saccharothrix carnea]|uniref:hypothetical protein n=1 Tax=Saccharothrix carnea TaxID=1280637 RepID=UPI0011B28DE0|nr:hypothetical protein [Saccharothrix carnea]
MPSARGANAIRRATVTARAAGSHLVVLASGQTRTRDVEVLLAGSGRAPDDFLVLNVADLRLFAELGLRTSAHPLAAQVGDLAEKRNVGLVVARLMGWRNVLFLDDDVWSIPRADLVRAAALLSGADRGGVGRRLVGWAVDGFRDLSAVGHARSHGTDHAVSFIGGGAMALACDPPPPFFPPLYNEDLVLGLELLRGDPGGVRLVGRVGQDDYDPFGDLSRAAGQEFGEVLVEGLARRSRTDVATRPEFWQPVLVERRTMLRGLADRMARRGVRGGADVARTALATHGEDWPKLLAGFVADWNHDLPVWRAFLLGLPTVDGFDRVAAVLGQRSVA